MVIEHVEACIKERGTLGGLSGEGLEAGNKEYRHVRRTMSRFSALGLRDSLTAMWLRSNPRLSTLFDWAPLRENHCGKCGTMGHNTATCTEPY
jgi:hypothetical protein